MYNKAVFTVYRFNQKLYLKRTVKEKDVIFIFKIITD